MITLLSITAPFTILDCSWTRVWWDRKSMTKTYAMPAGFWVIVSLTHLSQSFVTLNTLCALLSWARGSNTSVTINEDKMELINYFFTSMKLISRRSENNYLPFGFEMQQTYHEILLPSPSASEWREWEAVFLLSNVQEAQLGKLRIWLFKSVMAGHAVLLLVRGRHHIVNTRRIREKYKCAILETDRAYQIQEGAAAVDFLC